MAIPAPPEKKSKKNWRPSTSRAYPLNMKHHNSTQTYIAPSLPVRLVAPQTNPPPLVLPCRETEGDTGARIVRIYDPVTSDLSTRVIEELLSLDSHESGEPIHMFLYSPGGCVVSGLAIIDAMIDDGHDAGMMDRCGDTDLAIKPFEESRLVEERPLRHLYHGRAAGLLVPGSVRDAHAALGELRQQPKPIHENSPAAIGLLFGGHVKDTPGELRRLLKYQLLGVDRQGGGEHNNRNWARDSLKPCETC
jgi:hypothetical protein